MSAAPAQIQLEFNPQLRVDVIEVSKWISGDFHAQYKKALYCSHHTTGGFLDQSLCARLKNDPDSVCAYVRAFQRLFPHNAKYKHDQLHLRQELSDEQKRCEPRNADSHLTFIGSGLRNCAVYANRTDTPVYFIDLDGVNEGKSRTRHTTVIGFNDEVTVGKMRFAVPVSNHPVDSVNLKDPRLGLFEALREGIERYGISTGRIHISLGTEEQHAGLTINEYETLLMRHDLAEVLRFPLRFVAEKGRNMLMDPMAIPNKTISYARYDLVHVINELVDALGLSDSAVERLIDRVLTVTASRFLRMRRAVTLPVGGRRSEGKIIQGTYQSPILAQWNRADGQRREIEVTFVRFG